MRKSDKTSRRYTSHKGIIFSGHRVRFSMDGVKIVDNPERMLCLVNDNRDWFSDTVRNSSFSDNEINFETNNLR